MSDIFHGYLEMGGDEVVNRERARGYAISAGCPLHWFQGDPCLTLNDALGDSEYDYADINEAPWFDASRPETARFLGAYPTKIEGVLDSTRGVQVLEGIADGGVVQSSRRSVKELRVTALLVGMGADALEAGFEWLNHAVDPRACGSHSSACGETDLCYWTTCPPERPSVSTYTDWAVRRVNLFPDTYAIVGGAPWATSGTKSTVVDPSIDSPSMVKVVSGSAAGPQWAGGAITLERNRQYTVAATMRTSTSRTDWSFVYRTAPTVTAGQVVLESNISFLGNFVGDFEWTFTTPDVAPSTTAFLGFVNTSVSSGEVLDITKLSVVEGETSGGSLFSGANAPLTDPSGAIVRRYGWQGAANASPSVEEIRSIVSRAASDEEYEEILRPHRRRMHGVMASSGPFVTQEFSREDFYAYMVEFTLTAGKPYTYTMPQLVEVQSTTPTLVQDQPRNLVPYPSVFLAGPAITVAQNLAPNPSVETNATDWASGVTNVSGAVIAGSVTSGRSTDLSAGGSLASYLVRLLGGGATAGSGVANIEAFSDVSIPASSDRRISLNMWAAAIVIDGAAPTTAANTLSVTYEFFQGTVSLGAATSFGSALPNELQGKAYTVRGIAVPNAATKVRMKAVANVTWQSSTTSGQNSDVRLYADTLSVSIP